MSSFSELMANPCSSAMGIVRTGVYPPSRRVRSSAAFTARGFPEKSRLISVFAPSRTRMPLLRSPSTMRASMPDSPIALTPRRWHSSTKRFERSPEYAIMITSSAVSSENTLV